jgi:redox-sensitive bicupin YhaK (pirin superfamily)
MTGSTAATQERTRQIVHRTHGRLHGPIIRLMSPSDLGQSLKPFVFLDLFDDEGTSFSGFGWHPHSGIATLTYLWEGSVRYEDTTGAAGFLPAGGVEPQDVRTKGPAAVLLGTLGEVSSPLKAPSSINYLAVRLKAGQTWRYEPPADHTICWVALASGSLADPESVHAGELAVFEPSNEAIDFHAEADSEFVLGSAASHPYELALGNYSVHTSPASLQAGEQRIAEIKERLQKEGRL